MDCCDALYLAATGQTRAICWLVKERSLSALRLDLLGYIGKWLGSLMCSVARLREVKGVKHNEQLPPPECKPADLSVSFSGKQEPCDRFQPLLLASTCRHQRFSDGHQMNALQIADESITTVYKCLVFWGLHTPLKTPSRFHGAAVQSNSNLCLDHQ